jgi:polyisoprenoid-binding protein YceI
MRFVALLLIAALAVVGCNREPSPSTTKAAPTTRPSAPPGGQAANGDATPKKSAAAPIPAGALPITPETSRIEFVGTKPNGKHDGGFKEFGGHIALDGDKVTKIAAEIDTTSLYSDHPKLTGHLSSPDFFDIKTHPTASFVSTAIKPEAGKDTSHVVTGDLTLLGKTKSISFPSKIDVAADAVSLQSEFKIKRFDFGMTYGKGKVDDDVTIKVSVKAPRK